MDANTLVSITSSLNNNEDIVESYIHDVMSVMEQQYQHFEIVLIDNGSCDNTVSVVKRLMKKFNFIRLIVLSRKYDEQVAYTAALDNSIGDYVIIMDLNMDPPAIIPDMVQKAKDGVDIVTAEVSGRRNEPFFHNMLANAFYRLSNVLTDYHIDQSWSNCVCFSRKMVNSILQVKDRIRYLKYLKTEIGYSHATIKYKQIQRSGKFSGRRLWGRLFFAFDTLISNSDKLIRIATSLSLLTSILSFGYIFYALAIKLFKSDVPEGWTSTSIVLSFMFAVMFFILFIIGEYIALVYKETRKAPLYHIADEFNSSVLFDNIREKNVI